MIERGTEEPHSFATDADIVRGEFERQRGGSEKESCDGSKDHQAEPEGLVNDKEK